MLKYTSNLHEGADYISMMERQTPFAVSLALNRTAAAIHQAINAEMPRVFDRPTPYTLRGLRVVRSSKDNLTARVDFRDAPGSGIAADRYLAPQVYGGGRSRKRFEHALERVSSGGYFVPGAGAELDAYGNMSRGQLVRVLSYLQAFGEQGYRANATARTRKRAAKMGKSEGGHRRINGVVYFVSRGKGSMSGNREQRLPAGVWRKSGTHGADVKPVLLAVDAPTYAPLLSFYETADEVYAERFDSEFEAAISHAMATAR